MLLQELLKQLIFKTIIPHDRSCFDARIPPSYCPCLNEFVGSREETQETEETEESESLAAKVAEFCPLLNSNDYEVKNSKLSQVKVNTLSSSLVIALPNVSINSIT